MRIMRFKVLYLLAVKAFAKKLGTITIRAIKIPVAILIVRIALLLLLAAFAVLTSADLLLWLAIPGLPGLMTQLGLAILLSAFALLLITGLLLIGKLIVTACLDYFSTRQRLQRRLLFSQAKQEQFKQLFYFKKLQINYFNEVKRKRLLMADNRQQLQALFNAIDKDLLMIKPQLSKTTYLQLQQENTRYRNQQDIEALLTLQQKIATLV
ncbi:MAG: hypothetical protein RIR39_1837 [Pseudomonadota bacterium]